MKVLLANPRGFCAGVEMAIDTVQELVDLIGTPLYVFHAIVHNKHVVERFVEQGVTFVERIDEVPEGETVVFSAHGVSPAVRAEAAARGLKMIDATCPLVTKVHVEARRYARMGRHILLIGHADHQEVKGTLGEAPADTTVVESAADVAELDFPPDQELIYLTQTTLSVDDAQTVIRAIEARFPRCTAPPKEDICYATTNRQHAVMELASQADLTLVVGSANSSNSVRLTEISENRGTPGRLVDDASGLDPAWFEGVETVLLTAGASAPEDLVEGVKRWLIERFGAEVEDPEPVDEGMNFALPVELRVMINRGGGKPKTHRRRPEPTHAATPGSDA
ncbi:4-hydroxy-3-methylbut-2-enyl diphosphate reductase [Phycisphaera mikurensis]|uniref:4-hydroxy-3-methylbut-2-enyl diphosphate reductase n=1 Tax=Phycisphaera mikurensis (strain NBRC 102666 / KCTC 22515 / FYK2301M01) TaxID=1142394 RepID=I0IH52_PHYMF|nr:4-hydroxy-3-methylbut-2-enyl diphosphate reductase [Phycisphaera mikurensis]MBB6440842.1 4-hydroxy-3-methylbut-2-enyl diphosphate reductase [Phycisphaera mikurensis]BAM04590.1 4-hydroxy-3-methylbut-2-enyl diphosphate reductase [Phycisphaera mikurensis NBRC 102666]